MKSFLVLCALVAVCAGGAIREKRGYGWGGYDTLSSGWNAGYVAPAAKVIAVNKVVNVQREVSVPQVVHVRKVISEPQVVTVKKVVPVSLGYSGYSSGLSGGYYGGYSSGYSGGYGSGWW